MQRKTITFDAAVAVVTLDDTTSPNTLGFSSIEIRFPDGITESIPLPSVLNGVPSLIGARPTMEKLQDIAVLRIEFWPILCAITKDGGDKRLAQIARSMGHKPPEIDATFRWLLIIREAIEKGYLTFDGRFASPSPQQ